MRAGAKRSQLLMSMKHRRCDVHRIEDDADLFRDYLRCGFIVFSQHDDYQSLGMQRSLWDRNPIQTHEKVNTEHGNRVRPMSPVFIFHFLRS